MKPAPPHLTCRELTELVTEYLEGKLSREDRTRFEMHLCFCDWCVTYLEQMRQVLRATGRIAEESLAPDARDALLAAFRGWKGTKGGAG
jgi:anti-sigma factor RsiW